MRQLCTGTQSTCLGENQIKLENSEGRTLAIGVADDGEIFGLQPDLDVKNQDLDSYENWLVTLLMHSIGEGVVASKVNT